MSVISRIINAQPFLSKSEVKIAEFLINHPEDFYKMTAAETAKKTNSSPATVIRFAKRMGFKGFTDLKLQMASQKDMVSTDTDKFGDIEKGESFVSIKSKLLNNAEQALRETTEQVSESEVQRVLEILTSSNQLYVFGVGASFLAATNICQKWNRLAVPASADRDMNILLPKVANASKKDVLWLVSNSGESPEVILAAKAAKKAGIRVIALTKFGPNSLSKLADATVHTSIPVESRRRVAATNSLMVQFLVIDIIYYAFLGSDFDRSVKLLKQSASIMDWYKKISIK